MVGRGDGVEGNVGVLEGKEGKGAWSYWRRKRGQGN